MFPAMSSECTIVAHRTVARQRYVPEHWLHQTAAGNEFAQLSSGYIRKVSNGYEALVFGRWWSGAKSVVHVSNGIG
jgi:hypothetical protein